MTSPSRRPPFAGQMAASGVPRDLRDPRSREYAIQTMQSLKRFLESKTFDAKHVEEELQLIKEHEHWRVCGFENIDAYLRAEIGIDSKQLQKRLAQDLAADPAVTPLARHGEIGRGRDRGVHNASMRGSTNAAYLVRRLKRDHPEIAEALARGEFPSARAAGIAAGIVTVKSRVEKTQAMVEKMTTSERRAFKRWFLETYS